ncbi:tetratricopeptide repeat protein [Pseudomaricurvus sp.]|uniref:tetratricopeptide repeat protein n=1 Tax=Pseudomaricurvus sp. TaxID=2004510 RepID=UPI003F6D4F76
MNYLLNTLRFHISRSFLPVTARFLITLMVSGLSMSAMATDDVEASLTSDPRLHAEFVGREVCSDCHQQQDQLWQGSDHDWAMKPADDQSVLADFNDVTFDHYGEKTRFTQKDGKYWVTTDNAKGEQETFEVLYTFGYYPLQQYLLSIGDGHLQALGVSWDSRSKKEGGQRWFHLYPDEAIPFDDALHWTGPYQNWNNRCADCHSTNLQRNYDLESHSYDTGWSEINVSCEACHGPGSKHVQLMQSSGKTDGKAVTADNHQVQNSDQAQTGDQVQNSHPATSDHHGFDRSLDPVGQWLHTEDSVTAQNPQAVGVDSEQLSVCGTCHSRRSMLDNQNLPGDFHQKDRLQLVEQPLYYGDGQIRDEVYVLGSFLQSKMHQQGVVCSDCHEPHSLKLKVEGNGVCAQCHRPDVFDQPEHHHHPVGSAGAQCVSCHMPETTYMVVDPRRDHSLRIPRPDLSAKFGTPNACNQCHTDKDPAWASTAVDQWMKASGKKRKWHFSDDLLPGLSGAPDAAQRLMKLAMARNIPDMVQASAVLALENHLSPQSVLVAQTQLHNDDAMVRSAAVRVLTTLPPEQRWEELKSLVNDSSKQVRLTVAENTADVDASTLSPAEQDSLKALQQEYQAFLTRDQDTADGQMALGVYRLRQGDLTGAEAAYRQALNINSSQMVAYLNLADLYRQTNDEQKVLETLRQGLEKLPQAAPLHHSLGLSLVRQKNYAHALKALEAAAKLQPGNARYGYVYGLILQQLGQDSAAMREWQRVLTMYPMDRDTLMAMFSAAQRSGNGAMMLKYAQRLSDMAPGDTRWQQMVQQLQQHFGN